MQKIYITGKFLLNRALALELARTAGVELTRADDGDMECKELILHSYPSIEVFPGIDILHINASYPRNEFYSSNKWKKYKNPFVPMQRRVIKQP